MPDEVIKSIPSEDNMSNVSQNEITDYIVTFRSQHVMLDRDLAALYGVSTKVLNQAVKRNIDRFPQNFRFQLAKSEFTELVTNCDRFTNLKHSTSMPYAFTEQGVAMLSAVLRSDTAIAMSIKIIEAFVAMRRFLVSNAQIFQRLDSIELHQMEFHRHQLEADKRIDEVFKKLEEKNLPPHQGIFYDGQVFDAYTFVASLIKSAKREILLIDNYVDETVLTLLDKRDAGVKATIYTAQISRQLQLDLTRHNSQFPPTTVNPYRQSHDRFLCIDDDVYHIGASIKDLGKKWFAFSKMYDLKPLDLINRINGII